MGSLESGRRYQSSEVKLTVEDQPAINILNLKNQGFLEPGTISLRTYSLNSSITGWIITTAASESLHIDYFCKGTFRQQRIQITSTSPNFGGARKYLVCPQCSTKREMLYHGKNGKFACRICHGFVYRSSQLNEHQRHEHMAQKYTEKLGGTDFIFDRKKPFRMWEKTFFKLQDKFFMHRKKSCDLFVEYSENLLKKYGSMVTEKKRRVFLDGGNS